MEVTVKGIKTYYEVTGQGRDLLILHGWGTSSQVMKKAAESFEAKMKVYNLDLPGFGKSTEPLENDWNIYTYADFVVEFCRAVGISNPVILAHSFGGRIALILAGKKMMDINKMILTGCAGIKPVRTPGYYIRVYVCKVAKVAAKPFVRLIPGLEEKMKKRFGSADYAQASEKMRNIMVNTVNEDLSYLLPQVAVPCLLVWGERDDATPLSDGRLMEQKIPDAGLVVMPGSSHYAFLENAPWFGEIIRNFCKKEMEEV